jgi:hypothetical protein
MTLLGLTDLREVLLADFNVQLTTSEAELLMQSFDPDNTGGVSIGEYFHCYRL